MEEMDVENEEINEEKNINEAKEKMDSEVDNQVNTEDVDNDSESNTSNDSIEIYNNEAEVNSLERNLAENSYDYGSHVALIKKLQKMGELERLRAARENMNLVYPLSPELWLSWIRDEISCATTAEQKDSVVQLCKRAINDYLSIEVWLEYLQFSIGNMCEGIEGTESVRQLFEQALTTAGLHTMKGAIIWEAFREFENVLLTLINPEKVSEKKEQLNRISGLFQRQLAYPLLGMNKTYEEYESWRAETEAEVVIDEKALSKVYEQSTTKLNSLLVYEEKLASSHSEEAELLDAYRGYLLYEKQQDDPGRVTVLYERAITDLSVNTSIWLDYLTYVEEKIKVESVLDSIYRRALRNVPWCSTIWRKRMRSYEKWERPVVQIQELLENALVTGFSAAEDYRNLWIAYLEYLRRRYEVAPEEKKRLDVLLNTFNRACDHMAQYFGLDGDPECIILQFWARTEGIHGSNMERARVLWADILSQGHSAKVAFWMNYIALERCYGDTKHLRKLYHKAMIAVNDQPEEIANSWLDFERDEGTLEQLETCEVKTREKLEQIADERRKAQATCVKSEVVTQNKKGSKRKPDNVGKWKLLSCSESKIVKSEKTQEMPKSSSNETESKSKVTSPPGFKAAQSKSVDDDNQKEIDNDIMVFVSNLDYTATEEEVKDALLPAGPITSFKMITDYKGRSKGYCYVELSNAEAVETALKLDRTMIRGRPMFVSKCDPNKTTRNSGFKYSSTLEKNKLFVKGLPVTTTNEEVEEIFKVHGTLKEVRLVTYRNGHSKGLAYVEYYDEAAAAKALLSTDGMKIQDKVISVAISQPPYRKKTAENGDGQTKSLGGTTISRTAFGVPKTLLSMVPRNVKTSSNGNNSANGSTSRTGNGVAPSMSNQDFRNMLFNKK